MSDIKQAFLNVEVHADHVDFLRFLWRKNGCGDILITYRFLVVVFGLTPSPFLLIATIRYHCEKMVQDGKIDEDFVNKFLKTLYMDDSINGGETVEEAFDLYKKSKWIMGTAGFVLRKWSSNNKEVMKMIKTAESATNEREEKVTSVIPPTTSPVKSVLGVTWDSDADEIIYDLGKIIENANTKEATKRNVLSIVASFFNPIGYLAPITTQGKVIFQLLCKSKIKFNSTRDFSIVEKIHQINHGS